MNPSMVGKIKCSRGAGRYGGGTARRGAAWTFNFFKETVPSVFDFFWVYKIMYLYSTVNTFVDFHKQIKNSRARIQIIALRDIIKSLRWGAREFLIFLVTIQRAAERRSRHRASFGDLLNIFAAAL